MKLTKAKILILVPVTFITIFALVSIIAANLGDDAIISIGFLFGFLTMPTSYLIDGIFYKFMNENVPMYIQFISIGISGLINIGIIEGLYVFFTRENKIDI